MTAAGSEIPLEILQSEHMVDNMANRLLCSSAHGELFSITLIVYLKIEHIHLYTMRLNTGQLNTLHYQVAVYPCPAEPGICCYYLLKLLSTIFQSYCYSHSVTGTILGEKFRDLLNLLPKISLKLGGLGKNQTKSWEL